MTLIQPQHKAETLPAERAYRITTGPETRNLDGLLAAVGVASVDREEVPGLVAIPHVISHPNVGAKGRIWIWVDPNGRKWGSSRHRPG